MTAQPTGTLPPDNAYVRDYRPAAVLGKPQIEPMPAGTASQRGMPPPTGVTPVTVRPQPDLPTQDRYIPVAPTSPDGFGYVTGTPGRSAVQSYDLQSMVVRENETFATLSVLFYGSDRYQHALAEFLRDRDPRLTRLTPGQTVDLPPAEELERRFAQMILPPPAAANRDAGLMRASAPAPDAATPEPRATPPAQPGQVVMPPMASVPQQPQGASTPARPQQAAPPPAERGYRVQVNDTLFLIAKRTLGDGNRWTEIYQLNRDLLQGGTQLRADMYLRLPADAQVDAPARPQ
ncbi:MAG TPA: LysM peptidoglycan-binding domain-containing protein [Gemmatales bacterium]|nr:LysM peptidoglycan-binding domain-containing protein [Gemmatales bacterium]